MLKTFGNISPRFDNSHLFIFCFILCGLLSYVASVPMIRKQTGMHSGSLTIRRKPQVLTEKQVHVHTQYLLSVTFFSLSLAHTHRHTGFCLPSRQLVIELWLGEQSWIGADKENMTHNRSHWMELLNRDKREETPQKTQTCRHTQGLPKAFFLRHKLTSLL